MPAAARRASQGSAIAIGVLLLVAPTIAMLQFRGIALAVTLGLLAAAVLHRRAAGAWPRPAPGLALLAALALLAWLAVSAAWAAEPGRALGTALRLGGFVLLGAAAARAVRASTPEGLERLVRGLVIGLALGIALALADFLTGHAIRAFVRGLKTVPPELVYGLKPAVSVSAAMLPLVVFLPRPVPMAASGGSPAWLPGAAGGGRSAARPIEAGGGSVGRAIGMIWAVRLVLAAGGLAAALLLPADAARIATVAGLAAGLAAMLAGAWAARVLAGGLAALILAAPLLCATLLPRLPALEAIPPSAAHRILIWDFAVARIAERPLLGWGGEASRTIPGGRDLFAPATLERFGLASEASRAWFARPVAQRLPLHTHNAALQLWLELGAVGALLGAGVAAALGALAARVPPPLLPAATGAYAASAVIGMLSYGVWQEWWIGMLILLVVTLAALGARQPGPSSAR